MSYCGVSSVSELLSSSGFVSDIGSVPSSSGRGWDIGVIPSSSDVLGWISFAKQIVPNIDTKIIKAINTKVIFFLIPLSPFHFFSCLNISNRIILS